MICMWDNSNTWMVNTGRSIDAAKMFKIQDAKERSRDIQTMDRLVDLLTQLRLMVQQDNGQTGGPPDTAKIDGATRQWTDRWTS